jgi:EpsI family protein
VGTQSAGLGHVRRRSGGLGRFDIAYGLAVSISALALVWLIAPTLLTLHRTWLDLAYSHGYLVLAIVAGLVVRELKLAPLPGARASGWGVGALTLGVLGTLLAYAGEVLIVAQCLLPLLILSALWAVAGWPFVRRFWQPLFYLYFAIPFWDAITGTLRAVTTQVVAFAVHAVGIPAFVEANRITIPSGSIEIANGCSGLHFLIVGLALAGLYGLLYLPRWRERIVLALAAAGLSLFANYLRVFVLVVVGHITQMQNYLIVESHYYFGWGLFLVVIAPLVILGRRLEARQPPGDGGPAATYAAAAAGSSRWVVPALAALVTLGGGWLGHVVRARDAGTLAAAPIELPALPSWRRIEDWTDAWRPHYVGVGAEAAAWYREGESRVGVYVANYPSQRQGREAVFFANRPWGQAGAPRARALVKLSGADGASYPFAELRIVEPDQPERLVWRGLQVAGTRTASDLLAKLLEAEGAFLGRTDAQVVVMTAACEPGCGEARAALSRFATQAMTSLYACAADSTVAGAARGTHDE